MGFLGVTEPILELELERRLVEKIKQFLLELGQGFTYIGNQYVLSYNGKDYKACQLRRKDILNERTVGGICITPVFSLYLRKN